MDQGDQFHANRPHNRLAPPDGAEQEPYKPIDAVSETVKTTAIMGGAGAILSGVQNSLARQNLGLMGIFTRTGGTIVTFAAIGASYAFCSSASANLREKKDSYNQAIGGFFGGAMLGLRARSLPSMVGYGAGLAVLMFTYDYGGGQLNGYFKDPQVDEYERHEQLRRNRRRPIQETLAEMGEGRGVYGPGYEERRAERIKERYGIDVPIGKQPAGGSS
ncbi:NADH-ubiquinone oxidoreductase 213 kDa subunit [Rhizodiscina lignyota]|uniref:NADH-ubiquinone oxidoreductase 213 kDa subunit n=1 Tax=Rhizodiscina lignyota TaxID=1504668 RepID=A0A9P4IDD3_9PEZI|nr:NADH-ubiquinone oxidoreductase 213 kDa subunit [Rhizodiscina lignyota]